jgi:hypothetical protein
MVPKTAEDYRREEERAAKAKGEEELAAQTKATAKDTDTRESQKATEYLASCLAHQPTLDLANVLACLPSSEVLRQASSGIFTPSQVRMRDDVALPSQSSLASRLPPSRGLNSIFRNSRNITGSEPATPIAVTISEPSQEEQLDPRLLIKACLRIRTASIASSMMVMVLLLMMTKPLPTAPAASLPPPPKPSHPALNPSIAPSPPATNPASAAS